MDLFHTLQIVLFCICKISGEFFTTQLSGGMELKKIIFESFKNVKVLILLNDFFLHKL